MMFDQQDVDGMRSPAASMTSSQSSTSIGSRTEEEKAEDELFDQIEDLLGDMMRNPSPQHLPCRVFQCLLPDDPSRVLTATIVIGPAIHKNERIDTKSSTSLNNIL